MRAFVAFFLLAFAVMCCAPRGHAPEPARASQTLEVRKDIAVAFHGDTDFTDTERREIQGACDEWARVSAERVRYSVAWDLDFGSVESLHAHVQEPALVRLTSADPIVERFESELGLDGIHVRMVGISLLLKVPAVYIVVDRARDLRAVTLHELGHVAGLPDVEAFGNIMSGRDAAGSSPHDFTQSDVELCRKALLCP